MLRLLFSVTLLCRRRQLTVREYGALCCPDFPLAAPEIDSIGKRHKRPATAAKLRINFMNSLSGRVIYSIFTDKTNFHHDFRRSSSPCPDSGNIYL